ncbi:SDR family NAD(P)-dependent oxidoreductase [Rhodococcus sp. NPDC058514]|uniref:SDR family NAD(P)-dependent oxidoreductase n=1 Tax=unclassified Rhodococcus (in: high G+C Gram-positive bacteria) TaxID=192944 RepID=UPI0036578F0E
MSKTVVITGANGGIGLAMAHAVAASGARVVLACRNTDRAESARTQILRRRPAADVEIVPLDLASFEHIHRFATKLGERPVDALINNAGAAPSRQQYTARRETRPPRRPHR